MGVALGDPDLEVSVIQDLRYALRALRADSRFTLSAVAMLALGIAVNVVLIATAQVVLRPLPVDNPSETFLVAASDPGRGRERTRVSPAEYVDLSAQLRSVQDLAAFDLRSLTLTRMREPMRVNALVATPSLFSLWQTHAASGRTFAPGEEDSPVALVSHSFAQRTLGGATGALGRTLALDGRSYTVIGVLPADIEFGLLRRVDVWLPLTLHGAAASRDSRSLVVTGRVTSEAAVQQATSELDAIAARLARDYPATNEGIRLLLVPLVEGFGSGGNTRLVLAFIGLLGLLVLAVACANVGGLIVARGLVRQRQLAVRVALGASKSAIVRYQLVEALLLAVAAGTAGLLLAAWGVDLLKIAAGEGNPFFSEIAVNGATVLATASIALIVPLALAMFPAVQSARVDVASSLRGTAGGPRRNRLRPALVVAQIAMGAVLLVIVGLLVRSTAAIRALPVGFEPAALTTFRVEPPAFEYTTDDHVRRFHEQLAERLAAVGAAGAIDRLPIEDRERTVSIALRGEAPSGRRSETWAALASVTPGYRRTMSIPLLGGRDFAASDTAASKPVAAISRLMADRYWPGADPIGQMVRIDTDGEGHWREIVGVVGDVRNSEPDAPPAPQIYVPHAQRPTRAMAVVVRSSSAVAAQGAIRQAVAQVDPEVPIFDVQTMERVMFDDMADAYVFGGMLLVFAFIAVTLGASGIYGVVAYSVAQRRHEIGVRIALGASARQVLSLVLREGVTLAAAGAVLGAAIGYALARVLARALYGVGPGDPLVFAAALAILVATSAAASYLPARRASRCDPTTALKVE
jgi:putative ABC transport system permease protein